MSSREPLAVRAAIVAAVKSILSLVVILGALALDAEQLAAAYLVVETISTAVLVVWTRGKVTPVASLEDSRV